MASLNISDLFNSMSASISNRADALNEQINALTSDDGGNISQEAMLTMQFEINQYNMMLEMASTVTKSITDEAKQIAQRAN